jgi:Uma2 family endonuclease
MLDIPLLTLEEFLDSRFELPESGQWAELEAGRVELLQPPDLDHGNVILNLSKAVANWTSTHAASDIYACFDLGLILRQDPDTVRFPAVSFFAGGERFAELDKLATTTVPRLVTELASSSERRGQMPDRVAAYLAWGVGAVWVIDPRARVVSVHVGDSEPQQLDKSQTLSGDGTLPEFAMPVADLFIEPQWWTGQSR